MDRILAVVHRCLESFFKFHRKTPLLDYLFNKVAFMIKRYSNTGVFLGNLRNFKNTYFYRTPPGTGSTFTPEL